MKPLGVIHYGIGNVASLHNALNKIGIKSIAVSSEEDFNTVSGIILPGVGKFDAAMEKLAQSNFLMPLHHHVIEKKLPVLGVCLGMQMMGLGSDEGTLPGLGWLDVHSTKLDSDSALNLKVPNMGWSTLKNLENESILSGLGSDSRFYFAHSYAVLKELKSHETATCEFGRSEFVAVVSRGNIYGVQFHPEKSHDFGLKLLENFSQIASKV
jgi:glutamine amidotransferase